MTLTQSIFNLMRPPAPAPPPAQPAPAELTTCRPITTAEQPCSVPGCKAVVRWPVGVRVYCWAHVDPDFGC